MKKIITSLTSLVITIATVAIVFVAPVAMAASCGKNTSGKDIQTTIDYGCSGSGSGVLQLLIVFVNFMAIGVGVAVVGGIVFGALRYTSANGNAAHAQQGITYIVNSIIGLLLFIFLYALVNFLVPGGLFN